MSGTIPIWSGGESERVCAGRRVTYVSQVIAPVFAPVHDDMRRMGHVEYWLKGGRGSAKSSFASIEIVLGLLREPRANAIVYRQVAATLRESVYEQMIWAVEQLGLGEWFQRRLSPLELVYVPTGQRILFRGADDPAKSKSIKLANGHFGYLWFEELAEFPGMEAVRTIKASIIRGKGRAVTIYSYNPPRSMRNWVNREALMRRTDRMVHESCYRDIPAAWLGEGFLAEAEQLRRADERAYRHMYLGEAVGEGGQVFENVRLRPITGEEVRGFGATYAGLDFGWYPDPLHFVRCAYDAPRRRLWIYDEFRAVRLPNGDAARALLDEKGVTADEEILADSADQKAIFDLRAAGLRCVGAQKGPGSVRTSMKWLQGLREIVIDPEKCPAAAREFAEYEYERASDGSVSAGYPDRDNHAIDAVRYAMNRVWMRAGM